MTQRFTLCIALTLPAAAHASDGYRTANAVAITGGIATALAGPALGAGSLMIMPGPEHTDGIRFEVGMVLYVGGSALATGGGGSLAIGSLASRRAVTRRGGRVTAVPGAVATSLWSTGVAFAYFVPMVTHFYAPGWVAIGAYGSTMLLGTAQLLLNHLANKSLDARSRQAVEVGLSPTIQSQGAGLALIGRW